MRGNAPTKSQARRADHRELNGFARWSPWFAASIFLCSLLGPLDLRAASVTWDGQAASGAWATGLNWSTNALPANTDTLIFDAANANGQYSINLGGARTTAGITFSSAVGTNAFTFLAGNTLTVNASGITNNDADTQTFLSAVTANAVQNWNATTGALSFDAVTLAANLTLTGSKNITFGSAGGTFMNSGGNNSLINNSTGTVSVAGVTLSNNNTNRTVTFDGSGTTTVNGAVINGGTSTSKLTKTGTGNLILNAASTYTGVTTVNQGVLALGASGTISTANLSLAGTAGAGGAVLATQGSFARAFGVGANQVQLSGVNGAGFSAYGGALNITGLTGTWGTTAGFFSASTGPLIFNDSSLSNNVVTWSGNINLGAATRTITVNDNLGSANDFAVITGIISNGTLVKNGAGMLVLNAVNTFTGSTTVSAGTLNLRNSSALAGAAGTSVTSGAALELQGGITATNGTLTLNGTGVGGNGALRSVSGANTWNNNITLGSASTITSSTSGNVLTIGTFNVNTITMGANSLTVDGAGDTLIKSSIGAAGNTGGFVKNGTGTTTMQGLVNNYTGTTTVNAGTLVLDTANSQTDKTILGNLVIGAGAGGAADSVIVKYGTGSADNKIADTSQVTVNSDGKLDLNNRNDTIGAVVLAGGHIDSGTGVLTLNGDVTANTNAASRTAVIDGNLNLGNTTRTFTVANGGLASDLTVNSVINFGSIVKAGTGVMTLTNDNSGGYGGKTTINAGVLNIQNSNALGQTGVNDPTKDTTVATGAALQLQHATGISVGTEALTLNGTGVANDGALRNIGGANSWAGTVTLGTNSRINTDAGSLTISGDIIGTGTNLAVGTASGAATTFSGAIGTGAGSVTTDGSGTLTLSGTTANTFSGGLNVTDGTVILNKSASVTASGSGNVTVGNSVGSANTAILQLNQNEQIANFSAVTINSDGKLDLNGKTETIGSLAGSGTLAIGSGSLITGDATNTTFSGVLSGSGGSLVKQGSGSLTISSNNNTFTGNVTVNAGTLEFNGTLPSITGTLTLAAGSTLLLTGNTNLTVGTIHITGNTVIDFGGSSTSILNATTFTIDSGMTVTINGWANGLDYFYAQNWTGVTLGTRGTGPETQVTFNTYNNTDTAWLTFDNQITPAPEPATYGALLIGAALAFLGIRRYKKTPAGA